MNSNNFLEELQQQYHEAFESQDPELFDTVFEFEGKKLYADKLRLSLVSTTFKSMLSDRWNSSKETIKIKDYKFEDFKESLTFIYSGKCNITDENIYDLLDMAEFYQINCLKKICQEYLSNMQICLNNVVQLIEISSRYSLLQMKKPLKSFVSKNFDNLLKCDDFFNADESVIKDSLNYITKPEKVFEMVYLCSEYRATKKQHESANEMFKINDAIKAEMTPFLPHIQFERMPMNFLYNYVAKRDFLFSPVKMKSIVKKASREVKVTVTNYFGRSVFGYLPYNSDAIKVIKNLKKCLSWSTGQDVTYWKGSGGKPSTSSSLQKKDDIEWYLVYFNGREIGVGHSSVIFRQDYILAEMDLDSDHFSVTSNCTITIE